MTHTVLGLLEGPARGPVGNRGTSRALQSPSTKQLSTEQQGQDLQLGISLSLGSLSVNAPPLYTGSHPQFLISEESRWMVEILSSS